MMGGEGRQPSGKDCSPHRGSTNKGQTACVPQKSGGSSQTPQANQVRIWHNLPQTISDELSPLWPEENKCNYPSSVWESLLHD